MSDVKALDINGTSYDIKAVSVVNNGSGGNIKQWTGLQSAYDTLVSGGTVDSNTYYGCTDSGNLYLGTTQLGEGSRNIGEIVASTVPLTDAGLHLLDGALIDGSGIYSEFVDYIADLVTDYPDLFDTEANWQSAVSTYGVCGKFVYKGTTNPGTYSVITWGGGDGSYPLSLYINIEDLSGGYPIATNTTLVYKQTANGMEVVPNLFIGTNPDTGDVGSVTTIGINTGVSPTTFYDYTFTGATVNNFPSVRLPKITGFVEGTTDLTALGDLVQAGLPNITGNIASSNNNSFIFGGTPTSTGALSLDYNAKSGPSYGTTNNTYTLSFNASNSNSIYGNSSTVQPQSIKVLYYIVISTTTKTDIQVDIDEIATDLNGKADTDLSNLSNGLANAICTTTPTTTTSATAQRPAVVVENYINGTSGYRIWSDGFIEQWGTHTFGGTGWASIALLKSYSNSEYLCTVSCIGDSTTRTTMKAGNSSKNTTTILYLISGSASAVCSWYTAGY